MCESQCTTDADLLEDLWRLLRDGLIYEAGDVVIADQAIPCFAVTARGRDFATTDRLFSGTRRARNSQKPDAVDPVSHIGQEGATRV